MKYIQFVNLINPLLYLFERRANEPLQKGNVVVFFSTCKSCKFHCKLFSCLLKIDNYSAIKLKLTFQLQNRCCL